MVKGQDQTVIMMVHETLSHHYTTTYQISFKLSKKAKRYCPDTNTLKKYKLFDLKVKGQAEVTMKHDTPSHQS
jgi:hypothetical protein